MKFKSQVYTQASGSIGGITYSHNKGGLYTRARSIPTDPASTLQASVRDAMAELSNAWRNTLTPAQRTAWATYAQMVPLPDVFGDFRTVTSMNQYVRSNISRLQAGLVRVDDAPTIYNVGGYVTPTPGDFSEATQQASVGFTEADDWVSEDGAAMLLYCSAGVDPSIRYFKGPYRLAATIEGDSGTPPTTPETVTAPQAVTAGQIVYWQGRVTRADGRLSYYFRTSSDVGA